MQKRKKYKSKKKIYKKWLTTATQTKIERAIKHLMIFFKGKLFSFKNKRIVCYQQTSIYRHGFLLGSNRIAADNRVLSSGLINYAWKIDLIWIWRTPHIELNFNLKRPKYKIFIQDIKPISCFLIVYFKKMRCNFLHLNIGFALFYVLSI